MPLEFSDEDQGLVVRVDGDIVEIFSRGAWSHRVPLAWLAVIVQPSIRGRLVVKLMSARNPGPLYELQQKAKPILGSGVEFVIRTEEEPRYRQFFTQVAQLCGRTVAP